MSRSVAAPELELSEFVRPGDAVVWGQAAGEPTTLIETLLAQRAALGGVTAFVGSAFSDTLQPQHADHIAFRSMGAIGALSRLAKAGALGIMPVHVGQIACLIDTDRIACDVAFVQVAPRGKDGRHSFGLINDYVQAAVRKARVVIAEVNDQVPETCCDAALLPEEIDVIVETSRPPVVLPARDPGPTEALIAAQISAYVEDGSVLQMGVGALPDAVTRLIGDRRDLGCHSGMIGDGVWRLMEQGVLTNARKPVETGVTVTGALIGSRGLYSFAHRNAAIGLRNSAVTHGAASLAAIPKLVTINAAIEVDLTGQVNAEQLGADYFGGAGGQIDFVRAGARAPGGHSIIALPATARSGAASRIVARLSGPVTTARTETDIVVTEFGAADLRGRTLAERARAMIAIAHPDFRGQLERQGREIFARGF